MIQKRAITKKNEEEKERSNNWKTDLILRCQKDPVFFIEQVLGDSLWSKQKEICMALVDTERLAVPASYGVGKCVAFGEKIILADGRVVLAENLIDTSFVVLAWDEKTGNQVPAVAWAVDNGVKPVYRITTKSGRTIVRTGNHPLWSSYLVRRKVHLIPELAQWRPISNLSEGMAVAVPLTLNVSPKKRISEDTAKLIGYFLGDGATTQSLNFTQKEGKTLDDFVEIANRFNCDVSKIKNSKYDYRVTGRERTKDNIHPLNPLLDLFRSFGMVGSKSKDKSFPDFVWELENDLLALVVNRLFACDGWAFTPKDARGNARIAITLASEKMIRDVELAMLRLGIYGLVSYGQKSCGGKKFDAWTWQCLRGIEVLKFAERVGIYGKEAAVKKCVDHILQNTSFKKMIEWPYKNIHEGYAWEQIKSIEYLGEQPTVGISVPEYHTYLTSFVEHNTYIAARLALWFLYCFPQAKVISTAPTLRQVKDLLWAEIRNAHTKSNYKLGGEVLQMMIKLSDEQFAIGFSTDSENTDRFTGWHSPYQLVIFDQAGGLDPLIWESAEGLMTSAHCRWLAISNTAISDCELANICMPDRSTRFGTWKVIKITAEESPNVVAGKNIIPGLIAHDWVKKREEAWGRDDPLYRVFVKAEFIPDAQMTVVPYHYINQAFESDGELGQHIEVGLDVARMGLDSTVWTAVSGSRVLEIKRVTGNTTMVVVGETIEFRRYLEEKYGMPLLTCRMDVIGLGAGIYDRLVELDFPVQAVNNANVQEVVDKERYSNMRAEMAWCFRYRLEHGGVGLNSLFVLDWEIKNYVRGDMQVMKYKITSNGKIQLVLKEEIRAELGRSPDYWDSLVMAFEQPGGGPVQIEFIGKPEPKESEKIMTEEEWNIFIGQTVAIDDSYFDHEAYIS